MRLLLDTHIWFWSLADPARLGKRAARELGNLQNEIWLSPISVWELAVLEEKGRVALAPDPESWIRDALAGFGFREAPINHEIALESRRIDLPHQDPADRFLAATAKIYDLTLVTGDERLLRCKEFSSLANR